MFVGRLFGDTSGASFIDYSLIATLVSLVIIVAMVVIGDDIRSPFESIVSALRGGTITQ